MLRALLAAVLVVAALGVGPSAALQPAGDAHAEDAAVLALDGPVRETVASQSLDVATAVAAQREAARATLARRSLEVAFERAGDEQPRRELLFEAATEVEIAVSALRSSQRVLRERYVAREVTSTTFLRRQAVIEVAAEQRRRDLDLIRRLAGSVPRLSMRSRVQSLQAGLTGLQGPVTGRVLASVTGEAPPTRVYVSTSPNGTALATIVDGEHVRQGFRDDLWLPDSSTGLSLDAIEARAGELYPVAFNSSQTTSRGIEIVGAGVYRIEIGYEQGAIVAYLDGDTSDVFFEVQRQPLEVVRPGPAIVAVDNGTQLSVNRTYAGGPLRVAAVDNATGEPIEATVEVAAPGDDGVVWTVETGADGVAWTVMPGGEARVTATTGAGETSLLVRPAEPPGGGATPSLVAVPPSTTAEPK